MFKITNIAATNSLYYLINCAFRVEENDSFITSRSDIKLQLEQKTANNESIIIYLNHSTQPRNMQTFSTT